VTNFHLQNFVHSPTDVLLLLNASKCIQNDEKEQTKLSAIEGLEPGAKNFLTGITTFTPNQPI